MQTNTNKKTDFFFMDAFKRAFAHLQLEWQIVVMVGILYSIFDLIVHAPILDSYLTSLNAFSDGGETQTPRQPPAQTIDTPQEIEFGYAEFALLPMFFVGSMAHTFWGRFFLCGKSNIFKGGFSEFMSLTLQVVWRVICLAGWLFVFLIPLIFISNLILPNLPLGFATILSIIIISLLFLTGYSVLGPAVLAASIDKKLTIKQSWVLLEKYRPRFRQALMGLALVFLILLVGLMQLHDFLAGIMGESITLGVMISFIGGIFSMVLNFLWLHMTWQLVHHISPDLLSPENKKNETDIVI